MDRGEFKIVDVACLNIIKDLRDYIRNPETSNLAINLNARLCEIVSPLEAVEWIPIVHDISNLNIEAITLAFDKNLREFNDVS